MSEVRDPDTDQPEPVPVSGEPGIHQMALEDLPEWDEVPEVVQVIAKGIEGRRDLGLRKYGTVLQPGNGRDALRDAWDEALDMYVYLIQMAMEGKEAAMDDELCHAELILVLLAKRFLRRG